MKTIFYDELEFFFEWKCPNCTVVNKEISDGIEESVKLKCFFCKRTSKVLEPIYE